MNALPAEPTLEDGYVWLMSGFLMKDGVDVL